MLANETAFRDESGFIVPYDQMLMTNSQTPDPTPADLGFSMPAEWEPHAATWLGWPHHPTDWPGKLDTIRWVYGEIVRKIAPGEEVRFIPVYDYTRLAQVLILAAGLVGSFLIWLFLHRK